MEENYKVEIFNGSSRCFEAVKLNLEASTLQLKDKSQNKVKL